MAGPSTGTGRRRTKLALGAAALALVVATAAIIAGSGRQPDKSAGAALDSVATTSATGESRTSAATTPAATTPQGSTTGVVLPAGFSVGPGESAVPVEAATPVVTGDALSPSAVSQIIGRLPIWSATSGLATPFRWPTKALTKPAAGKTVTQPFPAGTDGQSPPTTPVQTPTGPLQVLRMQPQGSVSVAPFISITFNQPMVPVSTIGQLPDSKVPAVITPAIAGHWDWIGTETLRFTAASTVSGSAPVDRLPMATRFTVSVPAGTKSDSGRALAKAATATFRTPPPAVQTFTPGSKTPVGLHPVMVAAFNQIVDPTAVLDHLSVIADERQWPVRVATSAEIAADKVAQATMAAAPKGRSVAFVPTRDFPRGTTVGVTLKAGTPSAEGPLTTAHEADFDFSTYPLMSVDG